MDLQTLVRLALQEDVGSGDVTTEACIDAESLSSGRVLAKQRLIVAGQEAAVAVFTEMGVQYEIVVPNGTAVEKGTVVGRVSGNARAVLTGERLALNFLMRLSGIATTTRAHVDAAQGAFAVIDTRKTTPLHRTLEKAAVRAGGGQNHRFALYDGVLIKDNHLKACGGVSEAVARARAAAHHLLAIEVEADTLEQALEAAEAGADCVLLDNMDDDRLREAVAALKGKVRTEASGNMTVERLVQLREKGICPDQVSIGGLIHQSRWVDLSLEFD